MCCLRKLNTVGSTSVSFARNTPELITCRQPSPPKPNRTSTAQKAAPEHHECRPKPFLQAHPKATAHNPAARKPNVARKPTDGMSPTPASNTPKTAPSVFQVSKRPTC